MSFETRIDKIECRFNVGIGQVEYYYKFYFEAYLVHMYVRCKKIRIPLE